MWKHRWPIIAIALCLGCASTKGATSDEESPGSETEATEETPAQGGEESAGSEEKSPESETPAKTDDKPAATDDKSKQDKPAEKSGSSKKSCTGLKKDQCKITAGCAWNNLDKGKCVEEGASE